jgi:hypothetical protein
MLYVIKNKEEFNMKKQTNFDELGIFAPQEVSESEAAPVN